MSRGPKKKKYNKNKIKRDKNKLCRDIVRIPSNLLALYIYIYIKCTECIYSVCANVRLLRIVLLLARIFFHNHHDLFVPCMYSIYIYGLCLWCRSFPFSTSLFFSFYFSGISDVIWHIRRGFSWCHFDDGLRTIGGKHVLRHAISIDIDHSCM